MKNPLTTKYRWLRRMAYILRDIRRDNIRRAGMMVYLCETLLDATGHPQDIALKREWTPKIFRHPEVLARAADLWEYLVEDEISPAEVEEFRKVFRDNYGWDI